MSHDAAAVREKLFNAIQKYRDSYLNIESRGNPMFTQDCVDACLAILADGGAPMRWLPGDEETSRIADQMIRDVQKGERRPIRREADGVADPWNAKALEKIIVECRAVVPDALASKCAMLCNAVSSPEYVPDFIAEAFKIAEAERGERRVGGDDRAALRSLLKWATEAADTSEAAANGGCDHDAPLAANLRSRTRAYRDCAEKISAAMEPPTGPAGVES